MTGHELIVPHSWPFLLIPELYSLPLLLSQHICSAHLIVLRYLFPCLSVLFLSAQSLQEYQTCFQFHHSDFFSLALSCLFYPPIHLLMPLHSLVCRYLSQGYCALVYCQPVASINDCPCYCLSWIWLVIPAPFNCQLCIPNNGVSLSLFISIGGVMYYPHDSM
jgi:hypothetical protein